jgi:hypothetical protein
MEWLNTRKVRVILQTRREVPNEIVRRFATQSLGVRIFLREKSFNV